VQRAARFNTWLFFQNRDLPRDFPRLNGENHGKIMGKHQEKHETNLVNGGL
jgi:hypothetical protein